MKKSSIARRSNCNCNCQEVVLTKLAQMSAQMPTDLAQKLAPMLIPMFVPMLIPILAPMIAKLVADVKPKTIDSSDEEDELSLPLTTMEQFEQFETYLGRDKEMFNKLASVNNISIVIM